MKFQKIFFSSVFALALILSACAPAKTADAMPKSTDTMMKPTDAMMKPTEAMMEKPTETMMDKPTDAMMKPTEAMMDKPGEGDMMKSPAWFSTTLTNVNTGQTYTINDLKGKVVLVETMAQWCPSCKKQQMEVKALHEKLGMPADLVSIALDIDPKENGEMLKDYAASNGFDWIYTVAPSDVIREIGNTYGAQFLNPPSTPVLLIDRKGEVHMLPFGIKSADDLKKAVEPYLKEM
jgi:thiol-disulfide isomerase/thioredoxin